MEVTLIDKMGSDLTVVNAARVSFGKNKEVFEASDEKLISFLARHNHWSPFAHCSLHFADWNHVQRIMEEAHI